MPNQTNRPKRPNQHSQPNRSNGSNRLSVKSGKIGQITKVGQISKIGKIDKIGRFDITHRKHLSPQLGLFLASHFAPIKITRKHTDVQIDNFEITFIVITSLEKATLNE